MNHPSGPLLVIGGPGSGKTRVLEERFAWLLSAGAPPESVLLLAFSPTAADELRERLEARIESAYGELTVTTWRDYCARMLREEALEMGLDPFMTPVSAADRLAMLVERIDELPLAHHDLRGNPSALLASIVQRIDRLKAELVSCADYRRWAHELPAEDAADQARAAREREFAALYQAHDRMLSQAGVLDEGDRKSVV